MALSLCRVQMLVLTSCNCFRCTAIFSYALWDVIGRRDFRLLQCPFTFVSCDWKRDGWPVKSHHSELRLRGVLDYLFFIQTQPSSPELACPLTLVQIERVTYTALYSTESITFTFRSRYTQPAELLNIVMQLLSARSLAFSLMALVPLAAAVATVDKTKFEAVLNADCWRS